jgi:quercetin dioxygenase-like cupin family protein
VIHDRFANGRPQLLINHVKRKITMKITRIDSTQAMCDLSCSDYFEGIVNIQILVGPKESHEVEPPMVYFSPSARTKPHTHEHDLIVQIIEGQGIVATEIEERSVSLGDVVVIPEGIEQLHGAIAESEM